MSQWSSSKKVISGNTPTTPTKKADPVLLAKEKVDKVAERRFGDSRGGVVGAVLRAVSPFGQKKAAPGSASKTGMLLHVYVGDAQLESPPRDKLQMRLVLSGDVKQGGRTFSVVSGWKEGALVSFKNTQVMGAADDKGLSTIHFSLKGAYKDRPAEEETIGEAVLSTYAMESAIEKVIVLNPPAGDKSAKSNAPVGRMSVTLFLNRFAIDFNAETRPSSSKVGDGSLPRSSLSFSSSVAAAATAAGGGKPSSREYAFLLNRKLNWKNEMRPSTFNKQTEKLLEEDMSKHMKELRRSVQSVRGALRSAPKSVSASAARRKARGSSPEPKLAYGTQKRPDPPRSMSPTRKTNMSVGFIGASWPRPPKPVPVEDEKKIAFELEMAEKRRLMNLKAVAVEARQRAVEARLKSEAIKHTNEFQAKESDAMRRALLKQEEELARLRQSIGNEKRRGLNKAVQAHFLESEARRKLKEELEKKEKDLFMDTIREAAGAPAPKEAQWAAYYKQSSTLKVAPKKSNKQSVVTEWAQKQRRRADKVKRVRAALLEAQQSGEVAASLPSDAELDTTLRQIEAMRQPRMHFMLPTHHVRLKAPAGPRKDVSAVTSLLLAAPKPSVPPPTVPVPFNPSSPALPQSVEEATTKALERYKSALQRKQQQSLDKVAKSSLYGAAFGKVKRIDERNMQQQQHQHRSQSAPPASRRTASPSPSPHRSSIAAAAAAAALPAVFTKSTVASRNRRESKYVEWSDVGFPESNSSSSGTGAGAGGAAGKRSSKGGDDVSVDTETLVQAYRVATADRRGVGLSAGGGASKRSKSAGQSRRGASTPAPRARSSQNAGATTTTRTKSPAPGSAGWSRQNKRALDKMTKKSKALRRAADDFSHSLVDAEHANKMLLQPGHLGGHSAAPGAGAGADAGAGAGPGAGAGAGAGAGSIGVTSSASSVPGFLSSYIQVNAVAPSYGGSSTVSNASNDAQVASAVAALNAHAQQQQQQQQQHEQQPKDKQQADALRELIASVEISQGGAPVGNAESKVLAEIAEATITNSDTGRSKTHSKQKTERAKAQGALSPASNLRAAVFGDGDT